MSLVSGLAPHLLEGVVVGFALHGGAGPALSVTIRRAARGQRLAGPAAFLGRVFADLLALAALGATALLRPELGAIEVPARRALCAVAGLVLAVLGIRHMTRPVAGALHRDRGTGPEAETEGSSAADRLLATLLRPSWYLFWATGGAWLVSDAARSGPEGVAVLAAGMCGTGLLWHALVAYRIGGEGREWALSDRQMRVLTSLSGLLLVLVAGWALVEAIEGSGIRSALTRSLEKLFRA
jgi:threonine/homoserine/homoserine lactone efflux protein